MERYAYLFGCSGWSVCRGRIAIGSISIVRRRTGTRIVCGTAPSNTGNRVLCVLAACLYSRSLSVSRERTNDRVDSGRARAIGYPGTTRCFRMRPDCADLHAGIADHASMQHLERRGTVLELRLFYQSAVVAGAFESWAGSDAKKSRGRRAWGVRFITAPQSAECIQPPESWRHSGETWPRCGSRTTI